MSAAPDASPPGDPGRAARVRRAFRRHALAFLGVNAALSVANVFLGTGWWAFWPLALWSVALAVHYLRYKALTVDEEWVDSRATELRIRSYDRDHIENIKAHGPGAAARGNGAARK